MNTHCKLVLVVLIVTMASLVAACTPELPKSYTVTSEHIGASLEFNYNEASLSDEATLKGTILGPANTEFRIWIEGLDSAGQPRYERLESGLVSFDAEGKAQFKGTTLLSRPANETVKVWITLGSENPSYASSILEEIVAKPISIK